MTCRTPDCLALTLDDARSRLARAGIFDIQFVWTGPPPRGGGADAAQPAEGEQCVTPVRVLRQRTVAPGRVELVIAHERARRP